MKVGYYLVAQSLADELKDVERRIADDVDLRLTAAHIASKLASQSDGMAVDLRVKAATYYEAIGSLCEAAQQWRNAAAIHLGHSRTPQAVSVLEQAARLFEKGGDLEIGAKTAMEAAELLSLENTGHPRTARLYMIAKNLYGNAGMYDQSATAYVKEMRARKRLASQQVIAKHEQVPFKERMSRATKLARYVLWDITCLFGESLGRLVLIGIGIVLVFAGLYWHVQGFTEPQSFSSSLVSSLSIFSTFTIGTVAFRDPVTWGVAAVAEAMLGAGWQALVLSVLLRQLTRR